MLFVCLYILYKRKENKADNNLYLQKVFFLVVCGSCLGCSVILNFICWWIYMCCRFFSIFCKLLSRVNNWYQSGCWVQGDAFVAKTRKLCSWHLSFPRLCFELLFKILYMFHLFFLTCPHYISCCIFSSGLFHYHGYRDYTWQ